MFEIFRRTLEILKNEVGHELFNADRLGSFQWAFHKALFELRSDDQKRGECDK